MTDEKKVVENVEDEPEDDVVRGLLQERLERRRDNERLEMQIKELMTQLEDERHEFKRKQLGMSTLVTVLMDARFGEGGDVYIGREQFVRWATEGAAAKEDNAMLRKELEKVRDELRMLQSSTITHRMALQESTGIRLAELIAERDELIKLVNETVVREDPDADPEESKDS